MKSLGRYIGITGLPVECLVVLVVRVDELLARHSFPLSLELELLVIGLVFPLCRPGGDRMGGSKSVGSMVDRRRSLDNIRGERQKGNARQEKRMSSIEVGWRTCWRWRTPAMLTAGFDHG